MASEVEERIEEARHRIEVQYSPAELVLRALVRDVLEMACAHAEDASTALGLTPRQRRTIARYILAITPKEPQP